MTEVDISCLCGSIRTAVRLTEAVPVPSSLCHRSQCRYNLGALCHSALAIQNCPTESILDKLSNFEPHEGCRRFFCPVCGSHVFEDCAGWRVQSGVIERIHSEQVFDCLERVADHSFVHEATDGGLSACLTGSNDTNRPPLPQKIASFSQIAAEETDRFLDLAVGAPSGYEDSPQLPASCVCGGVQFYLTRPDAQSATCSSPWPDLIVPYSKQSSDNPRDVKWWIRDRRKWLAGTCACRSCRLGLGSPIQAWTFISKSNLFKPDGSPFTYNLGTLRAFQSSPGATREFCGRCGATVFWHNTDRPGVVDVSVGLLRAAEGPLARSWLRWWTERVSFAEDAIDKQLINLLQSNLRTLEAPS